MKRRDVPNHVGVLEGIEQDRSHHLAGPFLPPTPANSHAFPNGISSTSSSPRTPLTPTNLQSFAYFSSHSAGLWSDLKTMRWMRVPASSFQMILYPAILYLNYRFLQAWNLVPQHWYNPFEPLLFISHRIPESLPTDPKYRKGYLDILFILYYVIFWSFIRQSITLYVFHPVARRFGIKKAAKLDRFGEQSYAVIYFTFMSILGLAVMSETNTWWYETQHFWLEYPHWQMTPLMKTYYLLHSAYWSQQLLVLALRLEKPRKDYIELVVHHLVTLWLIGWSYLINLTVIGNAVFISMDVSDVFLAIPKICNYLQLVKAKTLTFAWFACVWTYFRHWLNLVMLWSVWTEFDLMPESAKVWKPADGVWMPYWMKYQIFAPLVALQIVNLFWYFLIWRILLRALFGSTLDDERSDDEGENEEPPPNGATRNEAMLHPSPRYAPGYAYESDKED